jgi:hypothetical protein
MDIGRREQNAHVAWVDFSDLPIADLPTAGR